MNTHCSASVLESALAGNLPAGDEAWLHRHLEECEECGAALERMAGGPALCREAALLLTGDELDAAAPTREEWSDVDFTVEHLEPADEPHVLGRLGGYDVLEIIGHGGMGVVLKAFDRDLKRCVAIKVLAPQLARSSLAKQRFAREAQAAAAVVHPHVLAIHQVQPGGRLPFLVMPLVAGESLAERLAAQGTLDLKEILRIGMQAAAGLAAAHEQGLVHRDVKPANILLEKGVERAVLTDFGLARAADDVSLTRWGVIAGTPQYMSPEQARGEPLDGRSDLFSLGCVLYEMATGVSPFRTDSTVATLRRLVEESPQALASLNPELPPWFIAIVERLLQKDPSRRFGSAREVSELFEGCLAHMQQPASVPLPASLPKPARSRAWRPTVSRLIGVLIMIAALALGLLGFQLISNEPPDIAGEWTGEEWGQVVLKKTGDGEYTGTYTDTFGKQPGELQFTWSRMEGRFYGTWREGADRFGEISLRPVKQEIRGAHTTDPKSKINPGTPRLADLTWIRRPAGKDGKTSSKLPATDQPATPPPVDGAPPAPRRRAEPIPLIGFVLRTQNDGLLEISLGSDDTLQLGDRLDVFRDDKRDTTYLGWISVVRVSPDKAVCRVKVRKAEIRPGDQVTTMRHVESSQTMPRRLNYFTTGHSMKVACSADGRLIAVANGNPTRILQVGGTSRVKGNWKPTVDILDADTGTIVCSLRLTTNDEDRVLVATERISHLEATALAFSPAGNVLAVGTSIGQVKLFDAQTGELIRSLDDEPAKLADKETPEHWTSLRRAMGTVASLAFSPDGSLLAVCGGSFADFSDDFDGVTRLTRKTTGPGRLKVWDVATGNLKHDLVGHSHANTVAFSPDGNLLASAGSWLNSGGSDYGTGVILWDPRTAAKIRSITHQANGGTRAFTFSPNGKMVAIVSQHYDKENDTLTPEVSLTSVASGVTEWKQKIACKGEAEPALSSDGKTIFLLCGQSIRFLDAATGAMKREIKPDNLSKEGRWDDFALAAQSSLLVIGAVEEEEGNVEVLDLAAKPAAAAPKRMQHFPTSDTVQTVACSPDGKLIAVSNGGVTFSPDSGRKRKVELLDAETGKRIISLKLTTEEEDAALAATEWLPDHESAALAFSPDGNLLAVGTGLGQVKLFATRLVTGALGLTLDDEPAKLAEKETPEKLKMLKRAMGSIKALAFSPDGSLLATCGDSFEDVGRNWGGIERLRLLTTGPGRLKVWDLKTGALKHDLPGHSHAEAVSFSADGSLLASAGRWSGRDHGTGVNVWNPQTGEKLRTIALDANGGAHAVIFSPTNKLVAIGSLHFDKENDTRTTSVSLAYALSGITEWQRSIPGGAVPKAFSFDGKSVAVLSGRESIQVFNTETGQVRTELKAADILPGGRWNDFAISSKGHRLVIGGFDAENRGFVLVQDLVVPSVDAK